MAKISRRNIKKNTEVRVDIRSLSWDEYRMIVALVLAASDSYSRGYKVDSIGSFDLSYINTRVYAHLDCFNTLAKLRKIL